MAINPTTGAVSAYSVPGEEDVAVSAVSWSAILAGTFATCGLTLILFSVGATFGLISVSPWDSGSTAAKVGIGVGVWLIVSQWVAAAVGGYIAGRMRTKWVGVHTHEVFFRDTAHGFLVWAVSAVVGVVFLSSAATSLVSQARYVPGVGPMMEQSTGQPAAQGQAGAQGQTTAQGTATAQQGAAVQPQASGNTAPSNDAQNRQMADDARKAAVAFSLFTCLSLLVGAFVASVAGALGGRQRDEGFA